MSGMDAAGPEGPPREGAGKGFLIVGIGGSAGAIGSFREFFRNVPEDSGMAYVVILHLSPEHESHLAEVLQSAARIPVLQVRDRLRVEPNHVYVIPPNRSLAISDGHLVLSNVTSYEERRAPIDIFFRTLAETHDSRAVSIIMSGSGSDGSVGLRRVKEFNGLVLVQDPAEAAFGEMPRHCIATGLVDFVVPVAEMPRRILHYREQLQSIRIAEDRSDPRDDEHALHDILAFLRVRTGQDFANYKRPTVLRRIERRMAIRDVDSLRAYAALMRERQEEPHALLAELLISVTNFFRDREVWGRVEQRVIPALLASKAPDDHLRIWVPGCATGEEAYTIAMLIAEKAPPNVQIFATDLDEQAIARARDGWYSDTEVADVPPERLRRFFIQDGSGYRVRRALREMVLFAHHNLIKDPPFSHVDFVSCRNLLIYLDRVAQQRALQVIHFALEPGGYLLLGTAEAADGSSNLFSPFDKEAHVYESRVAERNAVLSPVPRSVLHAGAHSVIDASLEPQPVESRVRERFAPIDLHHRLLEAYAPPSIVVDEQYNLIHLSERAGRYLQLPRGEATSNVLQLIRQDLRIDLRAALFQAAQKRTTIAARSVAVHTGERDERIDLIVRPALADDDPPRGFFLIVFEEPANRDAVIPQDVTVMEPATRQLEEQLVRLKGQMRATIEQYEVQAEEARAANEELQAMNEELRSTAEELETSQEELQSVNEELQTVNQELKVKIDEISHAGDDLRNLMASTDIGTIFVDRAFRVKLFTPRAREVFNLIAADVGRSLSDITHKLVSDGLTNDMARVLERLQTIEREVQTQDGAWYLMRLSPYRTAEDRIDGVVVTFIDITERHKVEAALRESETRYRSLFDLMDEGFALCEVVRDPSGAIVDHRYLELNPAFESHVGIPRERVVGRTFTDVFRADNSVIDAYARVVETGAPARFERQLGAEWFQMSAFSRGGDRFAVLFRNITANKRAEKALRESEARQRFLVSLGDALRPIDDPHTLRQTALRIVGDQLQIDRMLYAELTADGSFVIDEGDNYVRGNLPPIVGRFPVSDFRLAASRLADGETLRVDDVGAESQLTAEEKAAFLSLGIVSAAAVPLVKGGRWLLTLCAQHATPHAWTNEEIDLLAVTAERTWAAVERARAEALLRAAEERYRTLFVSMDEGYAVVEMIGDPGRWTDFRFLEVNPAFEKQTGMHDVVGRTATEILGTPNPDWMAVYGKVLESGEPVRFEESEPALGRIFDLYAFRLGDVRDRRVAVLFMDITHRKRDEAALRESQEQFHAIANVVPDLLWMSEPNGSTVWYNDRWLDYTGQSLEQAAGWGWTEALHPDDRARSAERYAAAVAAAQPLQFEHRIRSAQGEYRWFLVNAMPLCDPHGNVLHYYGAATDIHHQRIAREELEERVRERTQALLELSVNRQQLLERLVTAAEEERQRIARELHDEMGQHITALRVRLESLQPQNERLDEVKAIITRIDQSIDRLTLELRPPVALDQLGLHGALASLADEFSTASGIHVAVHLGIADGDRFSDAIESTLYRVVQESLTNVWKHSEATTVSVIVERERDALRLIVEDNGRGFDGASSADGAAPRGRFGLLGMRERLALVRGTLDVESQPGSGATIFVRVPLAGAESGA